VGGVIIAKENKKQIRKDMRELIQKLWADSEFSEEEISQFILHEMVVHKFNSASGNKRTKKENVDKYGVHNLIFKQKAKVAQLYDGLAAIIEHYNIPVMGATIDIQQVEKFYHAGQRQRVYPIAIQVLIENFVQFLIKHDGFGAIVIESQSNGPKDKSAFITQSKFYDMKARGTMFVDDEILQRHLGEIRFRAKDRTEYELQLADFVPNNFSRRAAGLAPRPLSRTLLNHRYDGLVGKPERFGLKMIP
jgi:hypothetical protein